MRTALALTLAALVVAGCARQPASVDIALEAARIRETDAAWLAAAKAHDLQRTASFWADDARIYPPGQPVVVGKAAIRKFVADAFATPGFVISWKTDDVVVAASGDLAYSTGTNHVSLRAPDGKPIELDGRATAVWKKQPDGAWKCVVDIWNQ